MYNLLIILGLMSLQEKQKSLNNDTSIFKSMYT